MAFPLSVQEHPNKNNVRYLQLLPEEISFIASAGLKIDENCNEWNQHSVGMQDYIIVRPLQGR